VVWLAARVLMASLLTALAGAFQNWLYERFSAPDLYAAGHPVARAVWSAAFSFPFILTGLLILGLPTAFLLRRLRAEGGLLYAAAGAATGALFGAVIGFQTTHGFAVSVFYGCFCALSWWWLRPRA
jgi:hypothetical protein